MSVRTLVRRLAEADLTFSDIKDDLRKRHAAWYLQHTELSMEAIASQLGYNDPTNFSRSSRTGIASLRAGCDSPCGPASAEALPRRKRVEMTDL